MRFFKSLAGVASLTIGLSLTGCGGTQATDMSGYNNTQPGSMTPTTVSSGTSFGAATLGAKLIPVQGKPSFVVGMNVATFSGQPSRELGKNQLEPNSEPAYNAKTVNLGLQDIAIAGCNIVRVRLFDKLDGLTFDSNGLVTGIDPTFLKNMSDMLGKAENNKLQVYVCLSGPWSSLTSVKNPITDPNARTAYFKKAVVPLVGNLRGRASVFAIDIIDEVEADVAGKDGNSTDKGATWDQARDFIKAAVDIIKSADPQRLVSSGSGLHGFQNVKAGKFSKLGLDFYDFHIYDDAGNLPATKELRVDRPVLVGSCGQNSKKLDNDLQAKADIAFLTNAQKQGYAGALLTEYGKDPDNVQSLLDKDGKHRPVYAQIQSFSAMLAMNATTTGLGR
jgi:hypothetical protein